MLVGSTYGGEMKRFVFTMLCIVALVIPLAGAYANEKEFEGGIGELVRKIQPSVSPNAPKPSVAILSFSADKPLLPLEKYLNSVLFEQFFATGKLKLIERENLDKILKEKEFQLSGMVDDASAKKIGKIIGVDYVCYGSMIDIDSVIRVSAKMVSIVDGEIVSLGSVSIAKDDYVKKILDPRSPSVSAEKADSSPQKIFWKSETIKNEFDGYTTFLFTLTNSPEYWAIVELDVYQDPSRNCVYAGVHWTGYERRYFDIKLDDGTIINYDFQDVYSYKDSSRTMNYFGTDKSRQFFNILLNNNKLSIRHEGTVQTFTTFGLAQAIKASGLSYRDFDQAMKNREF